MLSASSPHQLRGGYVRGGPSGLVTLSHTVSLAGFSAATLCETLGSSLPDSERLGR